MNHQELWQATLAKIELTISKPSFLTWFQETGIMNKTEGVVTVFVPNGFAKEWLQNKYNKTILHALREIEPEIKEISYSIGRIEATPAQTALKDRFSRTKRITVAPFGDETLLIKELTVDPETNLNPRYTLDVFVVGSFNELANAASQSVIKNMGTSYNPLFIYGGVGLGKTHLIQAIGNEVLKQNPHLVVRYVPTEKYMGEIVDALKNQEMNRLKEKYRSVDLLIMDDIQFIARTEKMQEEFFHTFNSLYERNKQIIISSDRPPHAMTTLEERLRSRFEGGMIADIGLPDFETRLVILKTKMETKGVVIPEDVLSYIAESIKTNIRELEGALNRVVMAAKLSNAPINLEVARKVISNHISAPNKFVTVKKIIRAVSEFYDIEEKELITRSRKKDVVKPRQIAMYLMRQELKNSFPFIGEKFGGRDHTTAIHSCEKIAEELKKRPELEEEIRMIKDRILLA
ncbi:MAG: hypothetical protein A3C07_00565 [Candidatus Sungbacteria bacterium RIFCSPHIGHO2_02_FULL_47_11]|uniref:Chromosomal replication initiator protein DnaA n=1 Tax=Candidatus Sungbacteria bacterium RIFCSPHIGHO2_02_FULL_47_11 TaxID=1802270 RepID=A0A1G2KH85_9BACT|nr:MAG: hypothetical protein A3C07_00565 [Candidatus Sungbacteria bacterium RIFCSPHIGHO2_02_FULL_47_11]